MPTAGDTCEIESDLWLVPAGPRARRMHNALLWRGYGLATQAGVSRGNPAAAIAATSALWARCTGRYGRPIPGCGSGRVRQRGHLLNVGAGPAIVVPGRRPGPFATAKTVAAHGLGGPTTIRCCQAHRGGKAIASAEVVDRGGLAEVGGEDDGVGAGFQVSPAVKAVLLRVFRYPSKLRTLFSTTLRAYISSSVEGLPRREPERQEP